MKRILFMQRPIHNMPEYDTLVVREIPELHDLKHWPMEFKRLAGAYLTVEPATLVDHLTKCSTPPTDAGLEPPPELKTVIDHLYAAFGTTYIVS